MLFGKSYNPVLKISDHAILGRCLSANMVIGELKKEGFPPSFLICIPAKQVYVRYWKIQSLNDACLGIIRPAFRMPFRPIS